MAWKVKGVWYEGCAAEGQCPYYFGRDREEPCKSFQLFQIKEGQINNVNIDGILVIEVVDLFSRKFVDLLVKGGEGGVYISDTTTEEQRSVLEPFFAQNVPGFLLVNKCLGVKFTRINLSQEGNTYHITMPYGELKMSLTLGADFENPVRLDNCMFKFLFPDIKICNTHFWKYSDFEKDWEFVNRSGVIADFDLEG